VSQEILFGVTGQSIYYDAPEGRASAISSVTVYVSTNDDDGSTESATTGSASVAGPNTTLSGTHSIGATSLTVTSGTGIARGRRYLLTSTTGEREWVEVKSVSGTALEVRQPLKNDFADASTLQDCRITIAVDSTWVADKSNISDILYSSDRATVQEVARDWPVGGAGYRVRWVYTVAGETCVGVSFADLVRYQAKNLVTPIDVDRRFPNWLDRLPTDYQEDQGQALIDEAFAAIKMDALGDAQVVRRIRDTQVIRELTIHRANVLAQEAALFNGGTNAEQVKAAHDLYQQRYDLLIREPKVPMDQTGGGSSSQATRLPAWRR
jgi:hypothetical protein